jgi:hypothetical protein
MRTEKLIKKRDQAEKKMDQAKSTHDFDRWHSEYWKFVKEIRE